MSRYWIKNAENDGAVEGPYEPYALKFIQGFGQITFVCPDHDEEMENWKQAAEFNELKPYLGIAVEEPPEVVELPPTTPTQPETLNPLQDAFMDSSLFSLVDRPPPPLEPLVEEAFVPVEQEPPVQEPETPAPVETFPETPPAPEPTLETVPIEQIEAEAVEPPQVEMVSELPADMALAEPLAEPAQPLFVSQEPPPIAFPEPDVAPEPQPATLEPVAPDPVDDAVIAEDLLDVMEVLKEAQSHFPPPQPAEPPIPEPSPHEREPVAADFISAPEKKDLDQDPSALYVAPDFLATDASAVSPAAPTVSAELAASANPAPSTPLEEGWLKEPRIFMPQSPGLQIPWSRIVFLTALAVLAGLGWWLWPAIQQRAKAYQNWKGWNKTETVSPKAPEPKAEPTIEKAAENQPEKKPAKKIKEKPKDPFYDMPPEVRAILGEPAQDSKPKPAAKKSKPTPAPKLDKLKKQKFLLPGVPAPDVQQK